MNDLTHTYIATLTSGLRYMVIWPGSGEETVFRKGDGVPVTEELKRFLEAKAVDAITVDEGSKGKSYRKACKFILAPINEITR